MLVLPGIHDLWLFVISGLLLNITPGADSLYIATRSITQGFRAGLTAALGIATGCCVHIVAAAIGLSAILAASSLAFTIVKLLGAAYLVYIGVSLLLKRTTAASDTHALPRATLRTIFIQGFLTNCLNPKVALFFLAFVPQFIDPTASNKPLAFILLGLIFNSTGTLWCVFLAWITARAGALRVRSSVAQWLNRGVGSIFVCLGVRLALVRPG
jgi:threonine/homoserine/homoserine lactone efflux protein